jgi:ATP-dependent exoDNAse (exonuclease V) beta subunit
MTFTKKAADEMRSRIARLLELSSPSGLHVMTFHAFAFRLLKKNPGVAGLSEGFRLWDAPEQRHMRQRLGLTYSDERYGERLEPSRFLSEIAGRHRRFCIWTGPNAGGADDRLPLLNSDERQHKVGQGKNAAPSHRPDSNRDAAAVRPGKSARMQKRKGVNGPD